LSTIKGYIFLDDEPVLGEIGCSGGLLKIAILRRSKDKKVGIRDRLTSAIRSLELHRNEVQNLRRRLQERSSRMFENVVIAIQANENEKATIYANENIEIKKAMKVLWNAELALTQFVLRLESIRDVGEAVAEMEQAFGVVRGMEKVLHGLPVEMNTVQSNIQNTLTEMMNDLGQVAPDIHINLETASGEEILEEAIRYLDQQTARKELTSVSEDIQLQGLSQLEQAKETAQLATGDDQEAGEDGFRIDLVKTPAISLDEAVSQYLGEKPGRLDLYQTAAAVGANVDDVEKTVMKLVSEGKLRLGGGGVKGSE
jgi:division protein CdvB (Snf7/Vps24/ESCRT-III family)